MSMLPSINHPNQWSRSMRGNVIQNRLANNLHQCYQRAHQVDLRLHWKHNHQQWSFPRDRQLLKCTVLGIPVEQQLAKWNFVASSYTRRIRDKGLMEHRTIRYIQGHLLKVAASKQRSTCRYRSRHLCQCWSRKLATTFALFERNPHSFSQWSCVSPAASSSVRNQRCSRPDRHSKHHDDHQIHQTTDLSLGGVFLLRAAYPQKPVVLYYIRVLLQRNMEKVVA